MKKTVTLVLLAACCINGYSQDGNVSIKFCPLALADFVSFPTIQGGVEIKCSNRFTWYNEVGIKYADAYYNNTDTSFIKSSGFKLKTEVRYYFQRKYKTTFTGFYVAANAFFINDHHNAQIDYRSTGNDSTINTDVFGVKKNVFGVNAVFGVQLKIYKRFMFDAFAGVGIRYKHITTINEEYNKNVDAIISPIDLNIPAYIRGIDADGGSSVVPSITTGFRICYKL